MVFIRYQPSWICHQAIYIVFFEQSSNILHQEWSHMLCPLTKKNKSYVCKLKKVFPQLIHVEFHDLIHASTEKIVTVFKVIKIFDYGSWIAFGNCRETKPSVFWVFIYYIDTRVIIKFFFSYLIKMFHIARFWKSLYSLYF